MRKVTFFLIPIATVLIVSCKPTIKLAATSCSDYKSEDFEREEISENGIAIMPLTCDPGLEDQLAILQKEIGSNMIMHFGEEHVVRPEEASIDLYKAGLANEYSGVLKQYKINGTIQKDVILQLGNIFDIQYLLILHLTSALEGKIPKSIKEIYVNSSVWNTKNGEIVWKGSGGYSEHNGNPNELIALTAEDIVSNIGTGVNEGPCEGREVLINAVKKAQRNSIITGCSLIVGIPAVLVAAVAIMMSIGWGA